MPMQASRLVRGGSVYHLGNSSGSIKVLINKMERTYESRVLETVGRNKYLWWRGGGAGSHRWRPRVACPRRRRLKSPAKNVPPDLLLRGRK